MNKHFLNEEGITLTELLAALSLFAVVSALVMTVLFNVFQNSENISDNAQLRQDANLLVSTLRSHYNQDDFEDFEVRLNGNNSLLIDGQEVDSSMTSSIAELKINGENLISNENKSMDVTDDGTPLSINLTLKNEAGQTYNLFTTIEKPAELAIPLQVFKKPDPPVQPPGFTPQTSDYCKNRTLDTGYAYHSSNQFIPDGCVEPVTISANVHFSDAYSDVIDLKHNTTIFNVGGNLFVDPPQFNVDNKHPMKVGGDAVFKGRLELKNEAEFIATNIHAGGDNNGRGVVVGNKTQLEAKGSVVADGSFEILSQVTGLLSKIRGNLFANKLIAKEHARLNIGENLIIDGNLEMYDNVEIIVEGDAIINGKLTLGGTSKLTIKGNLTVTDDVIPDDNGYNGTIKVERYNGTIKVDRDINFSKEIPDWLKDNIINKDY